MNGIGAVFFFLGGTWVGLFVPVAWVLIRRRRTSARMVVAATGQMVTTIRALTDNDPALYRIRGPIGWVTRWTALGATPLLWLILAGVTAEALKDHGVDRFGDAEWAHVQERFELAAWRAVRGPSR